MNERMYPNEYPGGAQYGGTPQQGWQPQQTGGRQTGWTPQQAGAPQTGWQPQQGAAPQQGWQQAGASPYGYQGALQFAAQSGQAQPQSQPQQGYGARPSYAPQGAAQQGYTQQGYVQPQQGYPGYPNAQPQGQWPYPQQSYPQQPYQQPYAGMNGQVPYPPQGYAQDPYAQQNRAVQQQLNQTHGYPRHEPEQPRSAINWNVTLRLIAFFAVPALFIISMLLPQAPALKFVFTGAALVTVVMLWVRQVLTPNARLTLSAVYAALVVVALVSALTSGVTTDSRVTTGGVVPPAAVSGTAQPATANADGSSDGDGMMLVATDAPAQPTPDVSDGMNSEAVRQCESFFYFWQTNNMDNMLTLTLPSWQASQTEPMNALYQIKANRTPVEYKMEKISGSESDTSRTVTVTASMDKATGRPPVTYRMAVVMTKEEETWYVDPRSLTSQEALDATETPTPSPTPTATPLENVPAGTKLYYNKKGGGSYYHADPECVRVGKKWLPMASFTYGQLNEDEFKDLQACNYCAAPLRPLD